MSSLSNFQMEYRLLGQTGTGLKVSVLGFGAMTYDSVDETLDLLRCLRKYGVNFFDNAEVYGVPYLGMAETNFGKALKILQKEDPKLWRRSDLVLTTKLFFGPQGGAKQGLSALRSRKNVGVNEVGLTRKHLVEGMKDSLKRLQLDYVDIVYAHRPDYLTSVEQIVRSFNFLIDQGYAFHWGTSMWKPLQIAEAHWIAKLYGLVGPVVEQPKYNMFNREYLEYLYLDLFKDPYYLGTTIWGVLDRGILSGKYNKMIPKNARLGGNNVLGEYVGHRDYITRDKLDKVDKLMKLANELGVTVTQLAIGWLIKNDNVTVCMLGATKIKQIEESMGAIRAANLIRKEHVERIEKILGNKPMPKEIDVKLTSCPKIISRL